MWPQQIEALREQCQVVCTYGAEAVAEMFGRDKDPREARLRDAGYLDEAGQRGARAAIEQHRMTLQQQPRPGPPG
jgi:hypothetical protein